MAIWSLTEERIEKLLKQKAEKAGEIEMLAQKSPSDLWEEDLEEFIEEWRKQTTEAKARAKKSSQKGRRGSKKLQIGGKGNVSKKLGNDSDSDFAVGGKSKKAGTKKMQSKINTAWSHVTSPPKASTKPASKPSNEKASCVFFFKKNLPRHPPTKSLGVQNN
jgi:DNA topoisomerase-2